MREPIQVWRLCHAPEELRRLTTADGILDWIAVMPDDPNEHTLYWLRSDFAGFVFCQVEWVPHPTRAGYRVAIGRH